MSSPSSKASPDRSPARGSPSKSPVSLWPSDLSPRRNQPKPKPKEKRWESRGTTLGIWIDVGSTFGKHMITLVTLLFAVVAAVKHGADSCHKWKKFGLSEGDELICFYTSSYLVSFVAACFVLLFLLGARDLLQKRFYYGLLKANGVLDYMYKGLLGPLKDPVVALVVWDLVHLIWYAGFLLYVMLMASSQANQGQPINVHTAEEVAWNTRPRPGAKLLQSFTLGLVTLSPLPATTTMSPVAATTTSGVLLPGVAPATSEDLYKTVALVWSVVLPGLLFLVLAHGDYTITKSLVPMSEYLESDDEEEGETQFDHLIVIQESRLNHILPEIVEFSLTQGNAPDEVTSEDDNEQATYSSIVTHWKDEKRRLKGEPVCSLNLMDSLWPAAVIMRKGYNHSNATIFRRCFKGFVFLGLVVLLVNIGALLLVARNGYYAAFGEPSRTHKCSLIMPVVALAHVLVVGVAISKLYNSSHGR